MARAPKVNKAVVDRRAAADVYGGKGGALGPHDGKPWKVDHRPPAMGYGQLDGVCLDDPDTYDNIPDHEKREFPGDCL